MRHQQAKFSAIFRSRQDNIALSVAAATLPLPTVSNIKRGTGMPSRLLSHASISFKKTLFVQSRYRFSAPPAKPYHYRLKTAASGFLPTAQRPIIRINSARLASSVKQPAYSMVTVCEPCFSIPRICIHRCCASTITITPRVGSIS